MHRRAFVATLAGATFPMVLARSAFARTQAATPAAAAGVRPVLQALLDSYVSAKKLAGAVVAVSTGGQPLTCVSAGRLAFDVDLPFDERSLCRVYSMTKPITGIAAMMLIEAGKLRLDQPVGDILPELRTLRVAIDPARSLDSRPATQTMTMRHLLTHTAGLGYWTPVTATDPISVAYRERGVTPGNYGAGLKRPGFGPQAVGLDDMVKRLGELPLEREPGTAWRYSIGLDVMGCVIERASGKALDVFFRERLFEPLKMTSSSFQVAAADASRLTTNYAIRDTGLVPADRRESSAWLKPPTLLAGGAGVVSTASDYARFSGMLLGDGELDGVRVLKADTARLAKSNLLPPNVDYEDGGFGAGMRSASGKTEQPAGSVSWAGAAGTFWRADPARRGTLILMTQHMPPTTYPIWSEVIAAAGRG